MSQVVCMRSLHTLEHSHAPMNRSRYPVRSTYTSNQCTCNRCTFFNQSFSTTCCQSTELYQISKITNGFIKYQVLAFFQDILILLNIKYQQTRYHHPLVLHSLHIFPSPIGSYTKTPGLGHQSTDEGRETLVLGALVDPFLVPLIGGRYHIITQLAVYTTYIPLIYCQLGDYISPTTY